MLQNVIAEAGLSDAELAEKIDRAQAILSGLQFEHSSRAARKQKAYEEEIDAVRRKFLAEGYSPYQSGRDLFRDMPLGPGGVRWDNLIVTHGDRTVC